MHHTQDVNIDNSKTVILPTPAEIHREFALSDDLRAQVLSHRRTISAILNGKDNRFLVVLGPCSIHNERGAVEYGQWLVETQKKFPRLFIVMRTMFEKPRTALGWKGMLKDPEMTGKANVVLGIRTVRSIMLKLVTMGLPLATETLSNIPPRFFNDLLSYATIGARSVTHPDSRELASIHSMPVGLKNAESGLIKSAVDAVKVAGAAHDDVFGIDEEGRAAVFSGYGNSSAHVVLRGGMKGANYEAASVNETLALLKKDGLLEAVVVDASHGNSLIDPKDPASKKSADRQVVVAVDVAEQHKAGQIGIRGVMIEGYIKGGKQELPSLGRLLHERHLIAYDISATDECLPIPATEMLLEHLDSILF